MIKQLDEDEAREALDDLCGVLVDCVEGGASVGFMDGFSLAEARLFWEPVIASVGRKETLLYAAVDEEGHVVGTVQVGFASQPNQPHRADLKKMLVHRRARGQGLARLLMEAAEKGAISAGRSLLVLDTATGEPAERIYERLGWLRCGLIPGYALFPDGRLCDTTLFYKRLA
ncbi:GNAT family N-acetyltransferase [Peteryoungia desertarenae]|uniref:GNAT family N-acetyltransferase n=1 Tax=Peteryoungia desertarenae TaxID=1813451 RepID=A0ABX6QRX4_9HYPH|nr:GNAT family N-acetyltransferase [Peteryoungia desertarenae]QLF71298.1 GNAT family N-acetyltransferase [Peteryoungia desertarenae]